MTEYKTIGEWVKDHTHMPPDYEPLLIKKLKEKGFDDQEILKILNVHDVYNDVCQHCYDGDRSCQCWNDE